MAEKYDTLVRTRKRHKINQERRTDSGEQSTTHHLVYTLTQ
jgi:hypothetical protein